MIERTITRRDFLKKTGAAAFVATAGLPLYGQQEEVKKTRVILIRNESVVDAMVEKTDIVAPTINVVNDTNTTK